MSRTSNVLSGLWVPVLALIFAASMSSARAASITWGPPATLSGDTDVYSSGTLLYASDWNNSTQTVNGQTFTGTSLTSGGASGITFSGVATNTGSSTFGSSSAPFTNLSTAYKTMLAGADYSSGATAVTVTLSGLTVGNTYAVQLWVQDARSGFLGRTDVLTSTGGNTITLSFTSSNNAGGLGQFAIGTFTADAVTQAFTVTGNVVAQINAMQVRTLTGTNGQWNTITTGLNWSAAGNWLSNLIADGTGATADFSKLDITADTTVHLDSARSVGNLIFGDTNTTTAASWILDNNGNAGNILTLDSGAPTITVNALGTGKTATISGGVAGSNGFSKAGAGTLTLSGANTYTGTTTLNTGTLQFAGGSALPSASAINLGAATLQIRNDGAGSGGTIALGNSITLSAAVTATIDVGNNGSANTGNTVAFGALNNGTAANAFTSTINFTGANGYLQSFSSLGLCGLTGFSTTLVPTTTSVAITGNVTNQESGTVTGHFDTLTLDGTSSGNAINGVISDSTGYTSVGNGDTRVTKSNTSTWTLKGSNTYHGPTAVNGGTLALGNGGNLSNTQSITVASGAILAVLPGLSGGTTQTATNADGGTLVLSAGSTFTMADGITSTFNVTGTATLPNGAVAMTFDIGGSSLTDVDKLNITGTASATANAAVSITINPLTTSSTLATGAYTIIQGGASSTLATNATYTLTNNRIVAGGNAYILSLTPGATTLVLNVAPDNNAAYWNGTSSSWNTGTPFYTTFAGTTAATLSSASDVFFTQANAGNSSSTLGANVTINSLNFLSNSSPTSTASQTISGSTLTLNSGGMVVLSGSAAQTLNSAVTLGAAQTWTNNSSNLLTVGGPISNGGFLQTVNGSGNTTISGAISGTGGLASNTTSTGTLSLTGVNSYTGATTIGSGTLQIGGAGQLNSGLYAGNITNAGTLQYSSSANQTLSGIISGTGTFVMTGAGTLTLSGANTYTGTTTVNAGTLTLLNQTTLASAITINPGGILEMNSTNGLVDTWYTVAQPLSGTGTINKTGTGWIDVTSTSWMSGFNGVLNIKAGTFGPGGGTGVMGGNTSTLSVNVSSGALFDIRATGLGAVVKIDKLSGLGTVGTTYNNGATFTVGTGNGSSQFDGTIVGNASSGTNNASNPNAFAVSLIKTGTGTFTITGVNTYTGTTTINGGTLQISGAGQLNSGTYAGAISDTGTLQFSSSANQTLSGIISGTGSLSKDTSASTLTLTVANTYTGATTVNAGSLILDHSGANTGALANTAVSVGGSATLLVKGSSSIGSGAGGTLSATSAGSVSLQDGTINTLSIGGTLTLNNAVLYFELNNATNDAISVGGTVSTSGSTTVNISNLTGFPSGSTNYTLISAPAGGLPAGGSGFFVGAKPPGFNTYSFSASTTTALILTVTSTATPATAYWTGLASSTGVPNDPSNNWGYGTALGTPKSNWSTDVNGTVDPLQVPGPSSSVFFTAANASSTGGALTTQLDGAYNILGLTFDTSPQTTIPISSVTLNTNGAALTLGASGLSVAAADNSNTIISGTGTLLIGASQSWANNSPTKTLTISSAINGTATSGSQTLTLNGANAPGLILTGALGNGSGGGNLALSIAQSGITTLSGVNTYTGATTIASGDTLQIGAAGSLGSGTYAGAIANSGTLQFSSSATQTLSGAITGTGTLIKDTGAGTLTLSNTGTNFTGATTINAGTLALQNTTGFNSPITVNAGTTLLFNNISATGDANTGATVNLNGAMVYNTAGNFYWTWAAAVTANAASTIDVTAGGISSAGLFLDGGLKGSAPVTVTSHTNGLGLILRNASSTYSGTITVAGNASTTLGAGSGLAIGPVPTTLSNATLTVNGTLELGNNASSMGWADNAVSGTNVAIDALNGTGVVLADMPTLGNTRSISVGNNNGSGSFSGVIANGTNGIVSFTKAGTGTQVLSGVNTYTGTTTVSGGLLQIGSAGSLGAGNYPGNIAITAALEYSSTASQTFSGAVSGAGIFTKDTSSANTLALTGVSTFTGSLNIVAGTVQIGGAGQLNSAGYTGTISNSGTLQISSSASQTLAGVISGSGLLIKDTSSTSTLTLGVANTYTGATTLSAGQLVLDHSGANTGALGDTAVSISGGSLLVRGNSSIGSGPGGTLSVASGSSVSLQDGTVNTLNISGNLTLNNSVLNFELGSGGTNDTLIVGGTVSPAGTTTINISTLAGFAGGVTNYTLISAPNGGLTAGGGGFVIGTTPPGFNTYSFSASTITALILTITSTPTPATAYWTGLASSTGVPTNSSNNWGYGNLLTPAKSNWSTTANGFTDPVQVPGPGTSVIFTAANASSTGGALTTQLDGGYIIQSLAFDTSLQTAVPISSVALATNGNTLTLGTGGLTVAAATTSNTTISGTGAVVLNANQIWANNSATKTLSVNTPILGTAISGSQTLTLNGTGVAGITLGGVLGNGTAGGNLALTVTQSGLTTLTGANTYTGATTINSGGTLQLGDGTTGHDGTIAGTSIVNNSTLAFNRFGSSTYSGVISGTGTVTMAGAGTQILSAANTYTGATAVNGGTLTLTGSVTSPVTVNSGGTYSMSGSAGSNSGVTVNSGGIFAWDTTGRASDQTAPGPINIGTIKVNAGGTLNLANTKTVAFGTQDALLNNQVLQGAGTVNQTGGGVVDWWTGTDISGFSGTYNVQNGIFSLQGSTAASATTTATVNLSATGSLDMRTQSFGCDKLTGSGTVGASFTTADTLTVGTSNGSSAFSGIIKNGGLATGATGVISLTKVGTGTFTLNGSAVSTYTGATTVSGGSLTLDFSNLVAATNLISTTSALNLSGGSLTVQGKSGITAAQTFSGITLAANTASSITLNANTGTAANLTSTAALVQNAGSTLFLDLTNAGTGAFLTNMTASTSAPWALVKDSTGAGFGLINAGKQLVRNTTSTVLTNVTGTSSATDFTTNPATDSGATSYNGGSTLTLLSGTHATNSLVINAGAVGVLDLGGNTGANALSFTGGALGMVGSSNFTIQNGELGADNAALTINQSGTGTLTISGTISSGTGSFLKAGLGTVILTGPNTYTGTTTIGGGTLQLGDGTPGHDGIIAGLSIVNNATLIFNRSGSSSYSGVISGTGAVTMTGAGTQTLSGVNSYTGKTAVSTGTLAINGVGTGSTNANAGGNQLTTSSISVAAGALVTFNTAGNFASANNGTTLSGAGTIRMISGKWWMGNPGGGTVIAMSSGGLIDVQGGTLSNDYSNANWSGNLGSVNVGSGAVFDLRNNNVTIDALTGTGSVVDAGFSNTLTVGAANGSGTFNGAIGTGGVGVTLIKVGTGTLGLSGANTYTGATTLNGGTINLVGSLAGSSVNVNNASAIFNETNAGGMSGSSSFTLNTGIATLAGTNTYSGVTTVNASTLTLSGSLNGSNINVNNASAIFNETNTGRIAGGTSTFTITTGNATLSGTNTYGGLTTINSGTLNLLGTLTNSSVKIAGGAVLRGTGTHTVGSISFTGPGTIFPGDASQSALTSGPKGSLTVGAVDFSTGGTLKIRVQSTGPGGTATADSLKPSASLALGGVSNLELHAQYPNGTYSQQDCVIVDGSLGGANNLYSTGFTSVNVTVPSPASQLSGMTILYVTYSFVPNSTPTNDPSVVATQDLSGAITSGSPSFGYNSIYVRIDGTNVTPVTVDSFAARSEGAGVAIRWNCVSEFQNAGFNVYRQCVEGGAWTQVNSSLIAGRVTNPDAKAYVLYDWPAPGEYQYKLESVSIQGQLDAYASLAGPVTVDVFIASLNLVTDEGFDAVVSSIDSANNVLRTQAARAAFDGSRAMPATVKVFDRSTVNPNGRADSRDAAARSVPVSSNPLMASRWFTGGNLSNNSTTFAGAKVVYSAPGVMLIPMASLPPGMDINHLAIQREGVVMPALAMTPAGLLVYGQGYEDDYTANDALFLRPIAGQTATGQATHVQGLFDSAQTANVESPAIVTASYHDVYFDYSTAFRPYTFAPWFSGQYLTATDTIGTTQTYSISAPNASSSAATLTVNLWSLTQSTMSPDHGLQVLVNGQPAGQAEWSGGNKMLQLTFQVPPNCLIAGSNRIDLVTPPIAGVTMQVSFLHSMTIAYTRQLDGSQPVSVYNSGTTTQMYELNNLPSANAWVVDARFPSRAALVPCEMQQQGNGTYKVRFIAPAGGSGQFRVVPSGMENVPLSVTKRLVKPVKATGVYLATGPSQFGPGIQPLLMQRAKEGLRGQFVDQEQLFDYYNYGRYGPAAIQNAVRSIRPQYVLLLGRTIFDYKNYSGMNLDPLCPAFLVSTTFWSQTTSDSAFGDLGRGYPEAAVGRLPVTTTAELNVAVQHVLNYAGAPVSGIRVHAMADQADPLAADFPAQAAAMQSSFPDMSWEANYFGVTYPTGDQVSGALQKAANNGTDWIVYVGHGNAAHLGNSYDLLDTTSVQAWTGNVVFLQSTCTANWMAKDAYDYKSIAIQALTQPQGGICASIATSTYMNSGYAVPFMTQLMKNAQSGAGTRWGNALMKTQQWAFQRGAQSSFYLDLGRTEQLFGDPAMPVYQKTSPNVPHNPSTTVTPPPAATPAPAQGTF